MSGSDMSQQEIDERLRIAREFKFRTGGEFLTAKVFDEDEAKSNYRKRARRPRFTQEERKARQDAARQRDNFRHKIAAQQQQRAKKGPTFGVTKSPKSDAENPRWYVYLGGRNVKTYRCAVEAAIQRNNFYAVAMPDYECFQIPLEAVFDKWGCSCGKHERGIK